MMSAEFVNRLPILLYGKPDCQQCKATERWLIDHAIPYRKLDVTQDVSAYENVKQMGYQQVPVTVVPFDWPNGGTHWYGFDVARLSALLD